MNQKQIGYIQIILSGAFFGFLGLFGKVAYRHGIFPGELLGLRFLISSILLGFLIYIFKRDALKMSLKNSLISILLGVFGYAVFSSCYFLALEGISASLTVLLLYTYPIVVALGARVFFKEQIGKKGIVALMLTSIGLIGLVWGEWSISRQIFLVYGLLSSLFYAIYILISRKVLERVSFLGSSFYVQLGAGLVLCMLNFSSIERPLSILHFDYALVVGMAIVCSLFPLTLFLAGLQKVSPSEASILSTTEPIFGVVVASLFLNEKLELVQILGGILVILGMILIALKNKKP